MYKPIERLYISLLQKYVGEQYMNNIEPLAAKLADYFVNDLNVSYEIRPNAIFKSITITGMVNNILDKNMFQMEQCGMFILTTIRRQELIS